MSISFFERLDGCRFFFESMFMNVAKVSATVKNSVAHDVVDANLWSSVYLLYIYIHLVLNKVSWRQKKLILHP